MYTINFEQLGKKDNYDNNYKLKKGSDLYNFFKFTKPIFIKMFGDGVDHISLLRSLTINSSEKNICLSSYFNEDVDLVEFGEKSSNYYYAMERGENSRLPIRKHRSFSMSFDKNFSKYPTSKIYGFSESFNSCPNILLSKEKFKEKYKSDLIPEYNYNLSFHSMGADINIHKDYEDIYLSKIDPIADHCIKEIVEVFSKYGEITEKKTRVKSKLKKSYFIKNSVSFNLEIEKIKEYKIDKRNNPVPSMKIVIKLDQAKEYEKEVTKKDGTVERLTLYEQHITQGYKQFSIEVREFDFLKKPAYYAMSMTPHGYLRLKREYSKDFFKKIIFHYQFKKFFEKYDVEVDLNELEDDPQVFFDLVTMISF